MVKVFHERNKYVSFSKGQIQEKEGQLKRDYKMLKEAKKQSGCHWNKNRCMIEGGPALWENLIVTFPKIKKFCNAKASFPLFDALGELYDGHLVEGTYNVTSLGDEEPLQQIHDLEDKEQLRQIHYVEDEESLRQIHDLEAEETQEDRAEEHKDEEHRDEEHMTAHQKRVAAIPRHSEEKEPKRTRTSKIVSMMEKYCEMRTRQVEDEAIREKDTAREKECAQGPDFSITRCISVLDTMEVTKVEKARAYTVFKNPDNREIFLSSCIKDPEVAMIWLGSEMGSQIPILS